MNQFHKVVSKKMWFFLFNVGTTLYMIVSGDIRKNDGGISLVSFAVALGLMNVVAWISARRFSEWK